MKRVLLFTVVLCFVLASLPVFAEESSPVDAPPPDTPVSAPVETLSVPDTPPPVSDPAPAPVDTPSDVPADDTDGVDPVVVIDPATDGSNLPDGLLPASDPAPVTTYQVYSIDGSPNSTGGLAGVIEDLFGTYTPKTQTVSVIGSDGSTASYEEYVPGVAGMDMEWIAGVVLFALILYCIFRLAGGVFR